MKGRQWIILGTVLVLVLAIPLPGCSQATTTAKPATTAPAATTAPVTTAAPTTPVEVKTLKFSYSMPKGSSIAKGFEWFATTLPTRSNGRFKVETYPSSSLIGVPMALDSAKKGVAEIVMTSSGANPSALPLSIVAELSTLSLDSTSVEKMVKAYKTGMEFVTTVPEVAAEYKDVHVMAFYPSDPFYIASKKVQINKPADFKGLKIGGSGQTMEIVTANGGAKIQQVPPESYLNLDKGVTDATVISWGQIAPYKINEVCTYLLDYPFYAGSLSVLFNKAAWDALSAADQKMITDLWTESLTVSAQGVFDEGNNGKKAWETSNRTIITPAAADKAAWEAAAQVAFDKWKADAITNKVPAETCDKVLAAWKALVKKNNGQ
jgi:TRAP-type transport system periplasmic protein